MAGDSASEWTEALSAFVVRNARAVIVFWILLTAGLNIAIPQLEEVVANDSTSFIPLDSKAVVGLGLCAPGQSTLYDAADDDSATGGPDPVRRLYPIVYRVDAEGAVRLTDAEVAAVADRIVDDRAEADRNNTQRGA